MSVLGNSQLLMTPEGYQISRSVRLRSSASAYLNRTFTNVGTRTTFTYSVWLKRGTLGSYQRFFSDSSNNSYLRFSTGDALDWNFHNGTTSYTITSSQVFRDPSAWYHIMVAVDTTQATSSNRVKFYVNGSQITAFSSASYPAQNNTSNFDNNTAHYISSYSGSAEFFDGYLTEINFIDGQALTPSSFGETDAATGVWKPKKYLGTYGTNGFYLNFSDNSAATAAAIGKDWSGNGNNWTPNNISLTAGATYDSMIDVPTLWSDGSTNRGDYAVMNPVNPTANTPSDGNLRAVVSTTENGITSTMSIPSGMSAYWEVSSANTTSASIGCYAGVASLGVNMAQSASYNKTGVWAMIAVNLRQLYANGAAGSSVASTLANTSILQVAVDNTSSGSNTYVWIGVDNVWYNSTMGTTGNPSTGANPTFTITKQDLNAFFSGYQNTFNVNFGQRPFSYTPPTGFKALNTFNLPDSTIKAGNKYFDASLWTGNGTSQSVVNSGAFQPDLVWYKSRSNVTDHRAIDSVRGITLALYPDATNAEATESTAITALNSNGFSLGAGSGNTNTQTFVGWQWKKGATPGFDIIAVGAQNSTSTYSVSHSLGATPKMLIGKSRSGIGGWSVWHTALSAQQLLYLQSTAAAAVDGGTPPAAFVNIGSSTFDVQNWNRMIGSGVTGIFYAFSEVAGFSKFGSYTGNGSADGPFVYCGFRPRWIMVKRTNTTGNWAMLDTSRSAFNIVSDNLYANLSDAETSSGRLDILSNGFKLRTAGGDFNGVSGDTYIFAAFAENPFKYALAR